MSVRARKKNRAAGLKKGHQRERGRTPNHKVLAQKTDVKAR